MFQQYRGFGGGVEAATQSLKALGTGKAYRGFYSKGGADWTI